MSGHLRVIGYCAVWVSTKNEWLVLHRSRITTEEQARATIKQWSAGRTESWFVFRVETVYSEGSVDLPELSDTERTAFEGCAAKWGITDTTRYPTNPGTYLNSSLRVWWHLWKAARAYYYRRLFK